MQSKSAANAEDLERELEWFGRVLEARFRIHQGEGASRDVSRITPPDLEGASSEYARFVRSHALSFSERLALVLALVPCLRPQLLDAFYGKNPGSGRRYTEFGGTSARAEDEFVPTGETLAFLLGGNALTVRFEVLRILDPSHVFTKEEIWKSAATEEGPALKAPLSLSEDLLALFTLGEPRRIRFGTSFPAQHIETELGWDDVILPPATRKGLEEIQTFIQHGQTLLQDWGMARLLRPGYRSLFYGPPGTGKTMTACLLGRSTGRDVYKVDISLVSSKYIGETEKNLGRVFDQAQHKGWILFFDEADALFGKRGEARDAHDRYANQEVAYLLQRIESFDGITILASNLRNNIDDAFSRRFESVIYFPMPRPEERLHLWQKGFSPKARLDGAVDLNRLAREHVLSGGAIMNVIRYASLQALKEGGRPIRAEDLAQGVQKEYAKEGKGG